MLGSTGLALGMVHSERDPDAVTTPNRRRPPSPTPTYRVSTLPSPSRSAIARLAMPAGTPPLPVAGQPAWPAAVDEVEDGEVVAVVAVLAVVADVDDALPLPLS